MKCKILLTVMATVFLFKIMQADNLLSYDKSKVDRVFYKLELLESMHIDHPFVPLSVFLEMDEFKGMRINSATINDPKNESAIKRKSFAIGMLIGVGFVGLVYVGMNIFN